MPFERLRRVDEQARVEALVVGVDGGVERARPRAVDDVERRFGVRAREDRPHDVVQVGDVDVLVHDDDHAAEIRADAAHRRDVRGLPRVAGIALLDRDRDEQPAPADAEAVGVDDPGHARGLQLAQEQRRAEVLAEAVRLVGRLVRRDAEEDRVVPVIDGLDVEHRLRARARGVVAGPLPEGALGRDVVVPQEAREDDLGVRRDRQLRDGVDDHLVGLAADAADPVVLGHPLGHLERGRDEEERVDAADDGDRAGLAALEVLVAELPAVLAGRDVHAHALGVVDHDAVRPEVDPVAVRVLQDVDDAGPDVPAAVERMPLRGRELEHVDVAAAQHVLENGPVLHDARCHGAAFLRELEERVHERPALDVERQAEREREALPRRVRVHEDALAVRVARDVVEEDGGGIVGVVEHLGDASDVLFPAGAAHLAQLAQWPDAVDPFAQVAVLQVLSSPRSRMPLARAQG